MRGSKLLLVLAVAVAVVVVGHKTHAQSEMQEEMQALKERVSDLERRLLLLLHEQAQDDAALPLVSELSSMPLDAPQPQTALLSVQVAHPAGAQREQREQRERRRLMENLVLMATPHALSLYSPDCRRLLHHALDGLSDASEQVLVSVATSPEDNLVLVGRTSTSSSSGSVLQSFALSAWRAPFNASSPASTSMRLRLALQPETAFRYSSSTYSPTMRS